MRSTDQDIVYILYKFHTSSNTSVITRSQYSFVWSLYKATLVLVPLYWRTLVDPKASRTSGSSARSRITREAPVFGRQTSLGYRLTCLWQLMAKISWWLTNSPNKLAPTTPPTTKLAAIPATLRWAEVTRMTISMPSRSRVPLLKHLTTTVTLTNKVTRS